jgi:hypothetical protein
MRISSIDDWEILDWNVFSVHGIVSETNDNGDIITKYDESSHEYLKSNLKNQKLKEIQSSLVLYKNAHHDNKIDETEDEIRKLKKNKCVEIMQNHLKKVKTLSDLHVNEIIQRLCMYFDILFRDILSGKNKIDAVIIENQPCLKNPKMKSIQIGLSTYFTIRFHVDKERSGRLNNALVCFISASSKLNFCKKAKWIEKVPKKDYKKTKLISVEIVEKLVKENPEKVKLNFDVLWEKEKKHDDLTDVILQAFAYFFLNEKDVYKNKNI